MQLYKRILKIAVIISGLIIIAGIFIVRIISVRALPDYNQNVFIEGLASEVTIIRDSFAVPSIYAESEGDLYRATGFVMAQDRLWQMDLLRRAATGRLSEIFGEEFTGADLLVRSLRLADKADLVLKQTDNVIIDALEAFADGVNQFVDLNRKKLPPEFSILGYRPEKWKPGHSVKLMGYLAWESGGEWSTQLILHRLQQKLDEDRFRELIPDTGLHNSFVHPHFSPGNADLHAGLLRHSAKLRDLRLDVFSGSNSWVVSGNRSTTGKPLFAHDMHLFFSAPGTWYQVHQIVEGKLNVSGVALPGQPLIIAGHNQRIAWGMTSVMVDDIDFYLETINPDNRNQYKFMGEWRDMEVRTELIKTGKNSAVEREVRFTHRGPVISDLRGYDGTGRAISMKWLGNEYSNELRGAYLLNRAGSWDEFRDAVSTFISISQNITYADRDGNIGIQTAAGIPVRKITTSPLLPGEDDSYDWEGVVPFNELPYTLNPPEGFVIAANNRTVPDDFPWYIGRWYDTPNRYERIREMLLEKEQFSADDFKEMLGDKTSKLAERMMPVLTGELDKKSSYTRNERRALDKLRDWDLVYRPERAEPLIFEKFYMRFLENLLLRGMGEELYGEFLSDKILVRNIMDLVWEKKSSAWLQENYENTQGSFSGIVQKSFGETIEWIENKLGPNPEYWRWGDIHILELAHPIGRVRLLDVVFNMNRGPWSPGGSFHTVCPYSYDYREPFKIVHGASHRHIYSTANWDESLSIVPSGTSGIPASEHYCDQTELFVNDGYRPDYFSEGKVEKSGRYRMKLVPAGNH